MLGFAPIGTLARGQATSAGLVRTLVPITGAYGVTGVVAKVKYSRFVTTGVYVLGGRAAAVIRGKFLQALVGVLTLTGIASTPSSARTIAVVRGIYALTGGAFSILVKGPFIAAAKGSYAVTGVAQALVTVRAFVAAKGAYVLTGKAVTWPLGLIITTGRYLLTGMTSLNHSLSLTVARGTFIVVGAATIFTRVIRFKIRRSKYQLRK